MSAAVTTDKQGNRVGNQSKSVHSVSEENLGDRLYPSL